MAFKLKSGNKPQFKQVGSSPVKHFVDDVPEHNDGHSDDLQTPEEHEAGKSPAKQKGEVNLSKMSGLGPSTAFGGVKNPELVKSKKSSSKKVMKDGPKNKVHYHNKPDKVSKDPHWQPHQFRGKKSPAKQTDSTYADGSKKSKREQDFSKRHTAEKAKDKYWYKIDGKKATKAQYLKYENKPGNMEGGGKQTNNPDVYGRIANNHGRGPKTKK